MDFVNRPVDEIKDRLKRELAEIPNESNRAQAIKDELENFDKKKLLNKNGSKESINKTDARANSGLD